MQYIVIQILVCLLLAGLVGLIIGWLIRSIGFNKKVKKIERDWHVKFVDLKDENKNSKDTISKLEDELEELKAETSLFKDTHEKSQSRVNELERELNEIKENSKYEVLALKKTIDSIKSENENLRALMKVKNKSIDELKDENKKLKEDLESKDDLSHDIEKIDERWQRKCDAIKKDYEIKKSSINSKVTILESKLAEAQKRIEELENEQSFKNASQGLEKSFEIKLNSLERKLMLLKVQLEKEESINKNLTQELQMYKDKVSEFGDIMHKRDMLWKEKIENLLKGN